MASTCKWVFSNDQGSQRLHRVPQRHRQGPTEERQAKPLDPCVSAQFQGDKLARGIAHGNPTTRGLSAGVLMMRVLTCVTFMLHSLCVCCWS